MASAQSGQNEVTCSGTAMDLNNKPLAGVEVTFYDTMIDLHNYTMAIADKKN